MSEWRTLGGREQPECDCETSIDSGDVCAMYDWLDEQQACESICAFLRWGDR